MQYFLPNSMEVPCSILRIKQVRDGVSVQTWGLVRSAFLSPPITRTSLSLFDGAEALDFWKNVNPNSATWREKKEIEERGKEAKKKNKDNDTLTLKFAKKLLDLMKAAFATKKKLKFLEDLGAWNGKILFPLTRYEPEDESAFVG
jgi:hypothetical protein